jgi:hypothetical protein
VQEFLVVDRGKWLFFGKVQIDLFIIEDLVLRVRPQYNNFAGKEVLGLRARRRAQRKREYVKSMVTSCLMPCTLWFSLR